MRRKCLSLFLAAALFLSMVCGVLPAPAAQAAGTDLSGGVKSLIAGKYHMLLLTETGELWAWGDNRYGQLGLGDTACRTLPVKVMSGVVKAAAGGWTSYALTSAGELWAWGSGEQGQLGVSGAGPTQLTPLRVMNGVDDIAAALNRAYALKNGTLWAWGNASNLYPDGLRLSAVPRQVASGVDRVEAGGSTTLLFRGGSLSGWGGAVPGSVSENKQLRETAVASNVTDAAATSKGLCYLANERLYRFDASGSQMLKIGVERVWAGESHFAAADNKGTLWTWGANSAGQLGTGDTNDRSLPVKVLSGAVCAAAGADFTCAAKKNGGVWAWGSNTYGQIAGGSNSYSYHFPHLAVAGSYDLPQAAGSGYHILINGELVHPDVDPVVRNNRILAPLRTVFEPFGTVDWDGTTRTVSATVGGKKLTLKIGEAWATVNGVRTALDCPAIIVSGRTMVPLRFISETLGAEVGYDASERTVDVVLVKQSLKLDEALRESCRRANLRIEVKLSDGSSAVASGVALHTGGLVLTNRHVVERAASLTIVTSQGARTSNWELFYLDDVLDCAILKVPLTLPGAARAGTASALRIGDAVAICGNSPASTGVVRSSAIVQFRYAYGGSFLCGAEPVAGNSGGGVYAASGLVGVVWGGAGGKTVVVPISSVAGHIKAALEHYGLSE